MTKTEIEKEWQLELKKFLDKQIKIMAEMTQEESNNYIRENKIEEKLKDLQKGFQKKYSIQK